MRTLDVVLVRGLEAQTNDSEVSIRAKSKIGCMSAGPGLTYWRRTSPFAGFFGRNPSNVHIGTAKCEDRGCLRK